MKIPFEIWLVLALILGVGLVGIVGGLYYAGWNLRAVFIDNYAQGMVAAWVATFAEIIGLIFLWITRPRREG